MKPLSRSQTLGALVLYAALNYAVSCGGRASTKEIKVAVKNVVPSDEWAHEVFASNGLSRWETYLHFFSIDAVKAGFLDKSSEQGVWQITATGSEVLARPGMTADQFVRICIEAFRLWRRQQLNVADSEEPLTDSSIDAEIIDAPHEERIEVIQSEANTELAAEILERLKASEAFFFERVVVAVLLGMGYGGGRVEAGRTLGRTGDGGLDGVIDEDALGLDRIYLQAKRWKEASVPVKEVRDFAGALLHNGARKGVFITTSRFTEDGKAFAANLTDRRIVLIDGERLARLMIEHNVGVSEVRTFIIKRLDGDFFSSEI